MSETNVTHAEAYYKAMNSKDLPNVAQYLHPDVRFLSPMAELKGKESVLGAIKGFMTFFNTLTIRAKFGSEDQVMLAYDVECPSPIGILRTASLMTFENGLIIRIELFFDARSLEKRN